jgi:cytochrome c biogenesis protein CcdA
MIAQITPLVQAAGRKTWLNAAASHVAGSTLSASALGFVLGVIGLAIGPNRIWPLAGLLFSFVLLVCAVRDAEIVRWPLLYLRRQTPAWFPKSLGWVGGTFLWGLDLGQGWTTLISFSGYSALLLWAFVSAHPIYSALPLAAYGLGRGLPVLVAGLRSKPIDSASCSLWYFRHQSSLQQFNAATLAFLAGYFLSSWS